MVLTPEQRHAQRSVIGVIQGAGHLHYGQYLAIWRQQGCEEWAVGAEELSEHFDLLEIPYHVVLTSRFTSKELQQYGIKSPGFELRVAWGDLGALLRWMPSFQKRIDAIEAGREQSSPPQP